MNLSRAVPPAFAGSGNFETVTENSGNYSARLFNLHNKNNNMNHYKNKKFQTDTVDAAEPSNIVIVKRWADSIGIEAITIWRWRKLGWIETVNINGHVYVSRSQIAEFEKRAKAGEFSKKHIAPGNLRNKTKTTT